MAENIIIASKGKVALIFIDGKVYGDHILEIDFHQKSAEPGILSGVFGELPVEGKDNVESFRNMLDLMLHEAEK